MKIGQQIIEQILIEKASIDWNNYLTPDEINQLFSKDDKVESAEEIIYNTKGDFYNNYFQDFKKEGWTKRELTQNLADFCYQGHFHGKQYLREVSKELENWRQQIDNMSKEQLKNYIQKLYKQYENFDSSKDTSIPPNKYKELLRKIDYLEKKLGYEQYTTGRKLN